jgi:hypothetical protein
MGNTSITHNLSISDERKKRCNAKDYPLFSPLPDKTLLQGKEPENPWAAAHFGRLAMMATDAFSALPSPWDSR